MKITIIAFVLLSLLAKASTLTTNEVFVQLQKVIESGQGFDDLQKSLLEIETKDLKLLLTDFDQTWPRLRDSYLSEYQKFIDRQFSGAARNETKKEIKRLRDEFMSIYILEENEMKPRLKETSFPAVTSLRKLMIPETQEVLATAPPELKSLRTNVLLLAKFRDAVVETAVLNDQIPAVATIEQVEKTAIDKVSDLPRAGLRVIAENDQIAAKAKVPASERAGIRELNEWRLLLGLNALVLDPKLCEASRSHSQDMKEHGFFAHESPLPGRQTPWDRAAQAGTKASGENIFMGSSSPNAANRGWFFSPGHHRNMFKANHTRIGLGQYETHWTQLFG